MLHMMKSRGRNRLNYCFLPGFTKKNALCFDSCTSSIIQENITSFLFLSGKSPLCLEFNVPLNCVSEPIDLSGKTFAQLPCLLHCPMCVAAFTGAFLFQLGATKTHISTLRIHFWDHVCANLCIDMGFSRHVVYAY